MRRLFGRQGIAGLACIKSAARRQSRRMRPGIAYAALAYVLWGLFPLYFRQLAAVPAAEVLVHRVVWSLLFVLVLLAWRGRWA